MRITGKGAALLFAAAALTAACDAPQEEAWPAERFTLVADDTVYYARSQFDPFQQAYYTEIIPALGARAALDREAAIFLVETEIGAQVCEGGRLAFDEDAVWSLYGNSGPITELSSRGGWQIVASCV